MSAHPSPLTAATVREGGFAEALAINTSGSPVSLKHGVRLCQCLVYGRNVAPEPAEYPSAQVSGITSACQASPEQDTANLEAFLKVAHYSEIKPTLVQLLEHYRGALALPGEPLGVTQCAEHHIKLKPNTNPVYINAYKLPHSQREVVQQLISEMLEQGVIKESNSPWNSPLFLVPKKDGSYRPVIDFRRVNTATVDDHFPLPVLRDLLMCLGRGNKVFTSLDLVSGYWQLPMAPESREITAFSTPHGHFEWTRMPFGLKGAPLTFQRTMNSIFGDLLGNSVYVYLDDIIIASKDVHAHMETLKAVLHRLQEVGLKLKITKCEFLKPRIKFLGHVVDEFGIHTVDDKIKAIAEFPQPTSADKVRSFLGVAGYYRPFIKDFAARASPLTLLLKKDVPFQWLPAQQTSFEDLKKALTQAPVLVFPDFKDPFQLCTDASASGLGAALMQTDKSGKKHVIAFASRVLTAPEKNYSVTHLEALAIVWALKHFRDTVMGYIIVVYTDHAAITDLFKGKNLHGRLARWFLTIQAYNPEIKYITGKTNVVADALSRNIPIGAITTPEVIHNFTSPELHTAQRDHPVWKRLIYALESGDESNLPKLPVPFSQFFLSEDNLLCRSWPTKPVPIDQLVIPDKYVPVTLKLVHNTPIAGHPGRDNTLSVTRRKFYWPTLRVDVEKHVAHCVVCAKHKGSVKGPASMLQYPVPEAPWDVVNIDLLQLPQSQHGSRYLLVCVDQFSRFLVLASLKDKTATRVAHALVTHMLCPHSSPRILLSDNGTEFRNSVLIEICAQFNITQSFITAYHPAANGLAERTNRKILQVLRPIVNDLLDNWEDWLSHTAASINTSVNDSTGKSPYYILYGVEKRLPYDFLTIPQQPLYNIDRYAQQQMHMFSIRTFRVCIIFISLSLSICRSSARRVPLINGLLVTMP